MVIQATGSAAKLKRSFPAPLAQWIPIRDTIYREIMDQFWDKERKAFVHELSENAAAARRRSKIMTSWRKRGGPVFVLGGIITVLGFILYPTCGLKMPQKDNPIYYRKKFGTASSINQQQNLAAFHYGQEMFAQGSDPVAYTEKGIVQKGNGYRIYLDNYKDMYC